MTKWIDYPWLTTGAIIYKPSKGILLVHRTDKCRDERWTRDLIGRGIDFGDTALSTIQKEIKEEVNLKIDDSQMHFLWFREQFRIHEGKPTHRVWFYYFVMLDEDQEAEIMEKDKFDDIGYFPLDDLPAIEKTNTIVYPTLTEFKERIEQLTGKKIIF